MLRGGSDPHCLLFLMTMLFVSSDITKSDKWCERIYNKDAERKYIQTLC